MKKIALWSWLLRTVGCKPDGQRGQPLGSNNVSPEAFPVKELVSLGEDEGWGADVRLSISRIEHTNDYIHYTVASTHNGDTVGLILSIPKTPVGEKGFAKGIMLQSSGAPSDQLLRLLGSLYEIPLDTLAAFVPKLLAAYVHLGVFGRSVTGIQQAPSPTQRYKLFLEGKGEAYAELLVNVNPEEHWVEIMEKDSEYRAPLLQFLQQPSSP